MIEYGISLGSNQGDRLALLRQARHRIESLPDTRLTAQSSVYETEPVEVPSRHTVERFLNAVLIVGSALEPEAMAVALHAIEAALGRRRSEERNAPRPIDLDMIYAGERRLATPSLVVPHPRWASRRFVVEPLAEVRPTLRLPGESRTVGEVLRALPPVPGVELYVRSW